VSEDVNTGVVASTRPTALATTVAVLVILLSLVPALMAATMLLDGGLSLSAPYPWSLFARVALAKSIVPVIFAILLAACALIPDRALRIIAAVASAVACAVMLNLIMLMMSNFIETLMLIPAVVYLARSRRPVWLTATALAIAPLTFIMSISFYA